MARPPLPNAWNLYNLRSSPFFQGTLEDGDQSIRPLSLFVGRATELDAITAAITGAGDNPTRHAIAGSPGIGKTTLVQALKARLAALDYLSTATHVPVVGDDTIETLFGRMLADVFETLLVNRRMLANNDAMKEAQALVRVVRLSGGGFTLSAAGFGGGFSKNSAAAIPKNLMLDGPRILQNLLDIVRTSDARGIVLHLNNLENLTEREAETAADTLRSLRDVVFQNDLLHTIVVGTTDAINIAVNKHQQLRTVFTTKILAPMSTADVHLLLRERYLFLRQDTKQAAKPPVTDEAVESLYRYYRGDLRGLLKALDDGAGHLLGFTGASSASGGRGTSWAPLSIGDLAPALKQIYANGLASIGDSTRVEQLMQWGTKDPSAEHTQASLAKVLRKSQPAVSNTLAFLVKQGYVLALPREGANPIKYVLSGTGRLIFG